MTRRDDWQARLVAYLARCAGVPWRPGQYDCALFVAGAVEAMTGRDLADGWRGHYRSTRAGLRLVRGSGYPDHIAMVADMLPEVAPALAQPGDVVQLAVTGTEAQLGILHGARAYLAAKDGGLRTVSRAAVVRAFGV